MSLWYFRTVMTVSLWYFRIATTVSLWYFRTVTTVSLWHFRTATTVSQWYFRTVTTVSLWYFRTVMTVSLWFPFHFNNIHDMTQIQINWNVPDCFKINVSFLVLFVSLHLKLKIVSDRLLYYTM